MHTSDRKLATDPELLRDEPAQTHDAQAASPAAPDARSAALARLDKGAAAGLLLQLQHGHGNAYCSRLVRSALLQRDATTAAPTGTPQVKGTPGATLSPREAVLQLLLKVYGADGLFHTMGDRLQDFEADMKTELGWYAGDKKESDKEKEGMDAAKQAAADAAKKKAKETITAGIKHLAGLLPRVSGPVTTAAGMLANVLWKEFDKVADYDVTVTKEALKEPHQHYIEATEKVRKAASRALQDELTASMDEMAAGSLDDVKAAIALVDAAIKQVDSRFYLDLVQGYRDIAPGRTVELQTPHARWGTGEKRGLWGGGTYVTPISTGTVYVEFSASSYRPEDIRIERTVVPELPRDVLQRFDSANSSLLMWQLVGTDEMVMEGKTPAGDVRIVKEAVTNDLKPAQTPSFTRAYCNEVTNTIQGSQHGNMTEGNIFAGAVNVNATIIQIPLSQAKLST